VAFLDHNSAFQSWVLTPEEVLQGSILTITQKQVIQNQLTMKAHQRINLAYDPANPMAFLQMDADLRGQMLALSALLDLSAASENQVANPSDPFPQE
jgi:hypothetical protein